MITYKVWRVPQVKLKRGHATHREGWFLFGFIPLYIRDTGDLVS